MKVLLVSPSRLYGYGGKTVRIGLPVGLMYIAAALERAGHEVRIFDFVISKNVIFQEIDNLTFRHGVPDKDFIDFLKQNEPDMVGIACPATAQSPETIRVSRLVRSVYPSVKIISGGPHFSVAGLDFMKENPQVDIAVVGEGELVMCAILRAIEGGMGFESIPGVIFRNKDSQLVETGPPQSIPSSQLNELPLPAYHLVDMAVYFDLLKEGWGPRVLKKERSVSVITSRGCPYSCVFCSVHLHMGRAWRHYSAECVLGHIDFLVKNYQIKHISFEDDNLTVDKQRFNQILDGLLERNYGITWDTPNGIRAETLLDENLVRKMKQSGCIELIIGIESGVQRVLDAIIGKNLQLPDVVRGAEICKRVGIPLGAFFIIGLPGESKRDIERTIKFMLMLRRKYKVDSSAGFATPLLGTRLYKICRENNFLVKEPTPKALIIATASTGWGLIKTKDFDPAYLRKKSNSLNRRLFLIKFYELIFSPSKFIATIKRKLKSFLGAR